MITFCTGVRTVPGKWAVRGKSGPADRQAVNCGSNRPSCRPLGTVVAFGGRGDGQQLTAVDQFPACQSPRRPGWIPAAIRPGSGGSPPARSPLPASCAAPARPESRRRPAESQIPGTSERSAGGQKAPDLRGVGRRSRGNLSRPGFSVRSHLGRVLVVPALLLRVYGALPPRPGAAGCAALYRTLRRRHGLTQQLHGV